MKKLYFFVLLAVMFTACNDFEEITNENANGNQEAVTRAGATEDPYKLTVMQTALQSVVSVSPGKCG